MEQLLGREFAAVLNKVHVNLPVFMFDEYFEAFLQCGIIPEIGLDCQVLDNVSRHELQDYARRLKAVGVTPSMHAPFMNMDPASEDRAKRAESMYYLNKALDAVAIFRPCRVVWHTCIQQQQPYLDPRFLNGYIQRFSPVVQWFAESLLTLNARLMLENTYEPDSRLHRVLLKRLEPYKTGFCLDTGHSHAFSRKPVDMWLKDGLARYLGEIHLHDNDGSQDAHWGAGAGSVDFKPLLEHLRQLPPANWPLITLEPHAPSDLLLSLKFVKKNIFSDTNAN